MLGTPLDQPLPLGNVWTELTLRAAFISQETRAITLLSGSRRLTASESTWLVGAGGGAPRGLGSSAFSRGSGFEGSRVAELEEGIERKCKPEDKIASRRLWPPPWLNRQEGALFSGPPPSLAPRCGGGRREGISTRYSGFILSFLFRDANFWADLSFPLRALSGRS